MPRGVTWRQLLQDHDMKSLGQALARARQEDTCQFVSWNARWMRSPYSCIDKEKLHKIKTWLERGLTVLLQETHWTEADAALWKASLQTYHVAHSAAIRGPNGGSSGGVAIITPSDVRQVHHTILVPGCAISVQCQKEDYKMQSISLYCPPQAIKRR